jgi:hypothetical protein
MAILHFICGKAASGKTMPARELMASHAAVMFGEDEWLTLLDAEINSLADHVRHSKRLKAVLAPFVSGYFSWVCLSCLTSPEIHRTIDRAFPPRRTARPR